jgi:hypothetical protein
MFKSYRSLNYALVGTPSSNLVEGGCLLQIFHLHDRGLMPMLLTHLQLKELVHSPQEFPKDPCDQGLGTLC